MAGGGVPVRCDRPHAHQGHDYVASPLSRVTLRCPGTKASRSIGQMLVEQPRLAEVPVVGVVRHVLAVSAA